MFLDQSQPGEDQDVLVDVDIDEGEMDHHHDSQMISQLISEGEEEDIDHTQSMCVFWVFDDLCVDWGPYDPHGFD